MYKQVKYTDKDKQFLFLFQRVEAGKMERSNEADKFDTTFICIRNIITRFLFVVTFFADRFLVTKYTFNIKWIILILKRINNIVARDIAKKKNQQREGKMKQCITER